MRRGAAFVFVPAFALMLTAGTQRASADEGAGSPAAGSSPNAEEALRVRYEAPSDCPDATTFFLSVRARTQRVRLADVGEAATVADVRIEKREGRFVGVLELPPETATASPFVRRVEADSCNEVTLALSLVLALAYDPDAITSFPDAALSAAATPPGPPPTPTLVTAPPPTPQAPDRPRDEAHTWTATAGVSGFFSGGFTTALSPIIHPFVEWGAAFDNIWSPRLSVGLLVAPTDEVQRGERRATFRLFGGRALGCPVTLRPLRSLGLAPCVGMDVGQLHASGEGYELARATNRAWLSAVGLAQVRWEPISPVFLSLEGGAGLSIIRDRFTFHDGTLVHQVPRFYGQVGFGVGVHFL